jgi:molecular chaperone DnaK
MGLSIGIDFGSAYTKAVYAAEGCEPQIICTRAKRPWTPSMVARRPRWGTLLLGEAALWVAERDPKNAIVLLPRLLGRRCDDPEVLRLQQRVAYDILSGEITGGPFPAWVMVGDRAYAPVELAAAILEEVRRDAEAALGQPVTRAAVTVPACSDFRQRYEIWLAARMAGLEVVRLVEAPVAAVYGFGMARVAEGSRTVLVYDLGGSRFEAGVVTWIDEKWVTESVVQDSWLGGETFDQVIVDQVMARLESRHPGMGQRLRADPESMWKLKVAAERAKKRPSWMPSADVLVVGALRGELDVDEEIQREEFEAWIHPHIAGTMALVGRTLEKAGLTIADIDAVLLAGGSTRLPLVRRLLVEKFGEEKIKADVDPMLCNALGAAAVAARSAGVVCAENHENEADMRYCGRCNRPLRAEPWQKCPHCGALHDPRETVCGLTGGPLGRG